MIECIFTLDYEIYGNGTGSLKDLVYDPGQRLREIFLKHDARFVNFVEVAEFEKIEAAGSDAGINDVTRQIRELQNEGFETALHLHPQWYRAEYVQGHWQLDYSEYNLCTLPEERISQIVKRALDYMRHVLQLSDFTPISFRAGNWLFQPTSRAAKVLGKAGLKIDSSVFKGGVQHQHNLDYRRASANGYYWNFKDDVNRADPAGSWIEVPIHSEMVPLWKMRTKKRMSFAGGGGGGGRSLQQKWYRARDLMRFLYPLKLDFCRMTMEELTGMMERVIREDQRDPETYRPIVSIGHTKDLSDPQTVDGFLGYLRSKKIAVSTFERSYSRLVPAQQRAAEFAQA